MVTKQERGTLASIPKSLHIVHGTWSTPDLLMKQDPQMERAPIEMHCCARSNEQTGPGQRLALFFLVLLGIGQSLGISFTCLEISELSLFDPLIIETGKLYLNDDNGWLYSLCDAIRQRYIFRLQWSYISTPLPSATCITYPSSDLKKTIFNQQINSSYIHEQ